MKIRKDTYAFLSDLSKHNDREWFGQNRRRYKEAGITKTNMPGIIFMQNLETA